MDALKVFYRIRHDQGILDALLCDLSFVFATGCQFQAMAAVQAQCAYVSASGGYALLEGRKRAPWWAR
jgi:hypothetical protein